MKTYWRTAAAVAALAGALTLGALLPATPGHTQVARTVVRVRQDSPSDTVPVSVQGAALINLAPGTVVPVRNVDEPARMPFQDSFSLEIKAGASADKNESFAVNIPAGTGLAIEEIN